MKGVRFISCFFLILLSFSNIFAAELAVIPYRVERLGGALPRDAGGEYAKYIGIASINGRKLSLYKQYQLKRDLKSMGISATSKLTLDECALICQRRMLSHLVSGTVYATEDGFAARSFLYSASHNSVIAKSYVKADSLGKLAEADVKSLFQFDMASRRNDEVSVDSVIMLDTSFNMADEISSVKKGLVEHYTPLFSERPSTQVYLQTYNSSERIPAPVRISGPVQLKKSLEAVNVRGGNSNQAFEGALSSMLSNVSWRRSSQKYAVFVVNSPIEQSAQFVKYANRAKTRGISCHIIAGARVTSDSSTVYSGIASQTGGSFMELTYHQLFRDQGNAENHLYYNSGRLYSSALAIRSWKEEGGLTGVKQQFVSGSVSPYKLEKFYREKMEGIVVSRDTLQNNADYQISSLYTKYSRGGSDSLAGRVLFEELGTSLWADVKSRELFTSFTRLKDAGTSFLLGVRLVPDGRSPYNFSFHPEMYLADLGVDDVPADLVVSLKKITATPEYYASSGFLEPPLWFVNVKAVELKEYAQSVDIGAN